MAIDRSGFNSRFSEHLHTQTAVLDVLASQIKENLEGVSSQIGVSAYSVNVTSSNLTGNIITVEIEHADGSITSVDVKIKSITATGKKKAETEVSRTVLADGRTIPWKGQSATVLDGRTYTDDDVDLDSFHDALINADVPVHVNACSSFSYITCSTVRKTKADGKVYFSTQCTRDSTVCE